MRRWHPKWMFRPPFNSALTVSQGLLNFSTCLSPQRQISHNCSSISFYFSAENFYPLTYSSFIRRGGELLSFSRKRNIDRWKERRDWWWGCQGVFFLTVPMWNCQLCVLAAQQICQYPPNMDLLDLGPRGKFSSLKSNRKFIPARISRSVEPCASFKAFLINCLSRKLQLKPFDHRFIATKTSSHCAAVITPLSSHLYQPCSLVPDPNSTMADQPSIPSISLSLIHQYLSTI